MRKSMVLTMVAASCLVARMAEPAGCAVSVPVTNVKMGLAEAGGFDMAGTPYADKGFPGPAIRFWAHGGFSKANSGAQEQFNDKGGTPWLNNARYDYKLETALPTVWSLHQANWAGRELAGCIADLIEFDRTVVEVSFADADLEGSVNHRGFYAVSSVRRSPAAIYDFDDVRGGTGPGQNVVPVQVIPVPAVKSAKAAADGLGVTVSVGPVAGYSDVTDGSLKLVKGVRLLYATGAEPTSSKPEGYQVGKDAKGKEVLIPAAGGEAQVVVPKPASGSVWFVAQVVFDDPSEVVSRAVSGHSAGVGADGATTEPSGGERRRGSSKRER